MFPLFVSGYDDKTTHPVLTQEIVNFYNLTSPNKLPSDETEKIIQGSIDEDLGIRWMHHFYDPVHNRGFTYYAEWMNAKEWAVNTKAQSGFTDSAFAGVLKDFFSGVKDYSWDRAIYEYAWGDKNRGFESLGHMLHLIEDMAVPDHTRNDPHPSMFHWGSPYETWAKKFTKENFKFTSRDSVLSFADLGQYFDSVSRYSNNNFFSKDTIFKKEFQEPKVSYWKNEVLGDELTYSFGYSENGHRLVARRVSNWRALIDEEYIINDPDSLILNDYWNLLSKQVVLHGAGVVKLFFDEVEKEKQTKVLYDKNRSWISKQIDSLKNTASLVAGIFKPAEREEGQTASIVTATLSEKLVLPSPPSVATTPITPVESVASPEPIRSTQPPAIPQKPISPSTPPSQISSFPMGAAGSGLDKISPPKPMIFSPAGDNQIFTATTVTFKGRAEKNSTVTNNLNSQTTTTDSSEDYGFWTLTLNSLPQGTSTIEFLSTDASSNTSEGIPRTIFVDSIGPSSSLTVSQCNQSLSLTDCLIATTTVTIEWSSSASDTSYYIIECENSGSKCPNFNFEKTTATTTTFTAPQNDTIYIFKAKAVDKYGNEGTQQSKTVEMISRPVIINEIAWAGTSATRDQDEWIELYNSTSKTVDISQMKLKSQTDNKPNISLSGTIPAKGYYLIERTNDNTISDITASTTSSFGNSSGAGLINTGEVLAIEYKGAVIDQTPAINACSGWCGGSDSTYYTMERYDPLASGTSTTNWGTWTGFLNNGLNADGAAIKGTPGKRNSINYLITKDAGPLNQNKALTKANSPYLINNNLTIGSEATTTLTIEPGVVIKFMNDSSLTVNSGKILAQGTSDDKIIFTSFQDDIHAGDTNQDGSASSAQAGNWRGIKILADGSIFDRTIIRYGGANVSDYQANLRVENASTTITNSVFEHARNYGAWLKGATTTVSANTFQNNSTTTSSIGLLVTDGAVTIQNNTFSSNTYGLRMLSAGAIHSLSVLNNTFSQNTEEAIDANNVFPIFSGNTASNNGTNGILHQGVISQNYSFSANLPYKISTGLGVLASTTLTLDAGVILKFTNSGSLTVQGNLIANGTSANKVVFTSIKDDSYGGDTNNDGSASSPQKADWNQVHLENATATSTIVHSVFSYGTTGLKLTNSSATLDNILFKTNTTGIKSVGTSTTTATNITFDGNTTDDDPSNLIP